MRRINHQNFQLAKRGTSREINRQILLNLVRTHQPISRADLARLMDTHRASVTLLVNELLSENVIFEGSLGEAKRGRKPTFLYIDSRQRYVLAIDIRATLTFLQVADLNGGFSGGIHSFPTNHDPRLFLDALVEQIKKICSEQPRGAVCEGIGVVVPGMVEAVTKKILHAPTLHWQNVELREPLMKKTGLPVQIENSGRACALAKIWATRGETNLADTLAFVSVSDGVGVGIVVKGDVLRGRHNIAGEFGHVPLSIDGPRCSCGATGCWEAYISNLATLSRYFGRQQAEQKLRLADAPKFTIEDLIARARQGDGKAVASLQGTARYLGLGLASIVNALDPSAIYLGGEIIAAWDLLEDTTRAALAERALTPFAASVELKTVSVYDYPRLRGAIALVTAPAFAAPMVA